MIGVQAYGKEFISQVHAMDVLPWLEEEFTCGILAILFYKFPVLRFSFILSMSMRDK